jgi:thymidylate synthase (FAD)
MLIVRQDAVIEPFDGNAMLKRIEATGRTAYRSEAKTRDNSAEDFVKRLIWLGHESVLEHEVVTARLTVDRGIQQELTRHRIGAYTIESTRYCDYEKKGLRFILPLSLDKCGFNEEHFLEYLGAVEEEYLFAIASGCPPEVARDVLPLCTASTVVMTYNLRMWRHVLNQRYVGESGMPHPKMVEVMSIVRGRLVEELPAVFSDIKERKDGR